MKDERPQSAMRLRTLRIAKGFTNQKEAAAHVRAETGVRGLSDSVWGEYESGRRDEHGKLIRPMSAKHREAIEAVLGPLEEPTGGQPSASPDLAALVDAITENTRVMTALLQEMRDERKRYPAWLDDAVIGAGNAIASHLVELLRTSGTNGP